MLYTNENITGFSHWVSRTLIILDNKLRWDDLMTNLEVMTSDSFALGLLD